MDAEERIDLASRLIVVSARLIEDVHPKILVAEGAFAELANQVADLTRLADRLGALSQCASVLVNLIPRTDLSC